MEKKNRLIIAIFILIFEIIGFIFSFIELDMNAFIYYTQISNMINLISIIFLIVFINEKRNWLRIFRFTSSCMLVLTIIVSIVALFNDPSVTFGKMFLYPWENGIYHHLICPILSIVSFIFFEEHEKSKISIIVPIIVTLIYGAILYTLNGLKIVNGPYPFFRVYEHELAFIVLVGIGIIISISLISVLFKLIEIKLEKTN